MRAVLFLVAVLFAGWAYAVTYLKPEDCVKYYKIHQSSDAFCHVEQRPKGAVFTCFMKDGSYHVFLSPGAA